VADVVGGVVGAKPDGRAAVELVMWSPSDRPRDAEFVVVDVGALALVAAMVGIAVALADDPVALDELDWSVGQSLLAVLSDRAVRVRGGSARRRCGGRRRPSARPAHPR
jgi:hypothetical protein